MRTGPKVTALPSPEQAQDDHQRDHRPDQRGDRTGPRIRLSRQGIRDRNGTNGDDRIDEVEQLPGPGAAHEQTEPSCCSHDQHDRQQPFELSDMETRR
jgi:hypothetical protein